jgi:FKBP-type peptidyl-prolyl cis-trans isomerase FkpA
MMRTGRNPSQSSHHEEEGGMILRRYVFGLMGVLLLGSVASCGDSSTGPKDPADQEFDSETGVVLSDMTLNSSGLYWQDLVIGGGDEATSGAYVTVHYTGWLTDGTVFDSSVGGNPASFSLTQVIPGWQEGVPGMKVGGKRKLVIPPSLGYGSTRSGSIPGNSTLVFDIELLGVVSE